MVVTPKEAEETFLRANQGKLRALEERIDAALVNGFQRGDGCGVCIALDVSPSTYLYRALEDKYNQAGWTVKYESDQRDGDFVRFTARRKQ